MKVLTLIFLNCFVFSAEAKSCVVGVYFGYNDQKPDDLVNDGLQKNQVEQQLTAVCVKENLHAKDNFLCGWERISYEDLGNYRREWTNAQGQKFVAEIRLRNSSMNIDDQVNRTTLAKAQQAKSDFQRAEFLNAFQDHDFIFYVGHSRFGYGPDFHPPKLILGQFDFSYYQSRKNQSAEEVVAIAKQSSQWQTLDLISCDSQGHFQALMQSLGPGKVGYTQTPVTATQSHKILMERLEARLKSCTQ